MLAFTELMLQLADATLTGGRRALLEDVAKSFADDLYFSVDTVAKHFDVSISTVNSWYAKGLLVPSFKVPGGSCRYSLADLEEFKGRMKNKKNKE